MTHDRLEAVALVGGVAAWNVLQNSVPRRVYGPLNTVGVGLIVATSRRLGLTADDLGMGDGAIARGLRRGGPAAVAVGLGVAVLSAVPTTRGLFRDERVERAGGVELGREVLFRIPIGTALFEEGLFRGLVLAWFRRRMDRRCATTASASLFGLWHILPTLRTLTVYRSGRMRSSRRRTVAALVAAALGTAAAGVGFTFLRDRSRSLVAPTILHATVNVASYLAAWMAAGTGGPERRPAAASDSW